MDAELASLSVIIPTLNRPDYLKKALGSIASQTRRPREVLIVDQSSGVETRELFENFALGKIRKVYIHQPVKGLIPARNNGIRQVSDSDFICFLDDDLELHPDFFEKLLARFETDHERKYAGGMGTFVGRQFQPNRFAEVFDLSRDGDGRFLPNGLPTYPHWRKEFCIVEFLSGGITMYRSEIIRANLFDERLIGYGYGDDADVSYRISRRHKNFFEPAAVCVHDDHSHGRDPGFVHRKQMVQNFYYLLKKNVGLSPKSLWSFCLFVLGQTLDDLRHLRKGAFLGNFMAAFNILRGHLDSVKAMP